MCRRVSWHAIVKFGTRLSRHIASFRPAVSRDRIRCSSASLIVPFKPSTSRSLKSAGW